jgi:hypothetical protein
MYTKENTRIEKQYRVITGLYNIGNCEVCKDQFKSRSIMAKYCSQRCKNDKAINLKKEAQNKVRSEAKFCIVCKVDISQSDTAKIKKYCSQKCKQKQYRATKNNNKI